jgi:peptidoglycan/LPS O-acetylase OafA/YrhL
MRSNHQDLPALTSLRFFAAAMILAQHATQMMQWHWSLLNWPLQHGVSFFFVLSGFILTHVYSARRMVSYGAFVRSRLARLWPVHLVALIVLCVAVPPQFVTYDGPGIFNKWILLGFNLTLLHAAVPLPAYYFSWNAVSWSISTEFFFYLAFPWLLRNIQTTWPWKLLAAAALAASIFCAISLTGLRLEGSGEVVSGSSLTYTSPFVRGFEFILGMAGCALWKRYFVRLPGTSAIWTAIEAAALAICFGWLAVGVPKIWINSTPLQRLYIDTAGSAWTFIIVIMAFAAGRGFFSRLLSTRPLVFLGQISFSIYMFHQILMKFFAVRLDWPDVPEILYFGTLFVIASASYLFIEKPAQRLLTRGISVAPPVTATMS